MILGDPITGDQGIGIVIARDRNPILFKNIVFQGGSGFVMNADPANLVLRKKVVANQGRTVSSNINSSFRVTRQCAVADRGIAGNNLDAVAAGVGNSDTN